MNWPLAGGGEGCCGCWHWWQVTHDTWQIFTKSTPRPIQSSSHNVRLCVCVYICPNRLIVDYTQRVRVLVFHHIINFDKDLMKFLYLKGYHNCMNGLKVPWILMTKSGFYMLIFFWSLISPIYMSQKSDWLITWHVTPLRSQNTTFKTLLSY